MLLCRVGRDAWQSMLGANLVSGHTAVPESNLFKSGLQDVFFAKLVVLSSAQVAYLLWRSLVPGLSLRVVSCVPAVLPCAGLSDECGVSWPCLRAELPQVPYFHNWPSPATSCVPNYGAGTLVVSRFPGPQSVVFARCGLPNRPVIGTARRTLAGRSVMRLEAGRFWAL